jgi:signal transduction histidine kinase
LADELAESRELLRRAAAERERLSRDLHDGTVQSLYAVGLGLGSARRTLGDTPEGERIEHALIELDEVVAELRRFLVQLDPGVSPVQRPELALGELVARLGRVSATELVFTAAPDFHAHLPPPVVLDLLQVVRESVSNALRHGHAARVEISLRRTGDRVRLEVRDDGRGFDVVTLPPNGGHGLANLRHRANAHGGHLEVSSQPGGPTVVAFEIPTHG